MNPYEQYRHHLTRRQFFARGKNALGYAALTSLLGATSELWEKSKPANHPFPISSPRPNVSSTSTWSVGLPKWTCLITSLD